MNPDPLAQKAALKKRESELHKIMEQMKYDKLQKSPVFKNLEHELENIKTQLATTSNN